MKLLQSLTWKSLTGTKRKQLKAKSYGSKRPTSQRRAIIATFLGICLINDWNERYLLSTVDFGERWLLSLRSLQLSNYLDCLSCRLYPVPAWHTGSSILPSLVSGIHSNGKISYIIISSSGSSPHSHNFNSTFCHFHQMLLGTLVYFHIVLLFEIKI